MYRRIAALSHHVVMEAATPARAASGVAPAASLRVLQGDIRDGFCGAVGNTPLIRLKKLSEETGCEVRRCGAGWE